MRRIAKLKQGRSLVVVVLLAIGMLLGLAQIGYAVYIGQYTGAKSFSPTEGYYYGDIVYDAGKRYIVPDTSFRFGTSRVIDKWQTYQDDEVGFSIGYPPNWKHEIPINQTFPYHDPNAIIRRIEFYGNEGNILLDIWNDNKGGRGLEEWLKWYEKTRFDLPLLKPNAQVNGQPAGVFIMKGQQDILMTYFKNDEYIFRLLYSVNQGPTGLDIYWQVLRSFSLEKKTAINDMKIPREVVRQATHIVQSSPIIKGASTCCNVTATTDNKFPCCDPPGNCTWWVEYRLESQAGVYNPFWGDAKMWWGQVPDYYEWYRQSGPKAYHHNIAWWDGTWGHVAYMEWYNYPDVGVSEQGCESYCTRNRTIIWYATDGYIYYDPPWY